MLRSDLDLPKIKDKDELLNQRVIDYYGTLVPLTELDDSLLTKSQKIARKMKIVMKINQMRMTIATQKQITLKIIIISNKRISLVTNKIT